MDVYNWMPLRRAIWAAVLTDNLALWAVTEPLAQETRALGGLLGVKDALLGRVVGRERRVVEAGKDAVCRGCKGFGWVQRRVAWDAAKLAVTMDRDGRLAQIRGACAQSWGRRGARPLCTHTRTLSLRYRG